MEKKIYLKNLLSIAFFFSLTFFIFAPYELYLGNQEEFWFQIKDIWWIPLVCGGVSFFTVLLVGVTLERWKKNISIIFLAFLFGVTLAIYIQGNFLNMKLGLLNGADVDWKSYKNIYIRDTFVWAVCIMLSIIGVVCHKKSILVFKYIALFLSLMQLITLPVLFLSNRSINRPSPEKYVSNKNIYQVSSSQNTIVFLLDMFDNAYFQEILELDPSIKQELDGFTYFENSTGNYSTTSYSIATLMTGEYLYNEDTFANQMNKAYEKTTYLNDLKKAGYELDIYSYESYIPHELLENSSNYIVGKPHISDYIQFTKKMYQLVSCKYFPNGLKRYIWMTGSEFDELKATNGDAEPYVEDNIIFYNGLSEKRVTVKGDNKRYKFIHINGAHYPYTIDEDATPIKDGEETTAVQCAQGTLKIVKEYLDELKSLDLYDKSAIVIMADHGYYWDGSLRNPVFIVKPQNTAGELKTSKAPISHHDFPATIMTLSGLNNNLEYGKSVFDIDEKEKRERLFYQYYLQEESKGGNYRLIEYSIESESNKREKFKLTDNEYTLDGKKIPHKVNCKYCSFGEVDPIETPENAPLCIVHHSLRK